MKKNLHIKVGKPWNEAFHVEGEEEDHGSDCKHRVIVLLAVCFVTLLFALTAYAMETHDRQTLTDILVIVRAGLIVIGVWATGRAALKVLSGWKDQ
jgi:multisubunit Na+/H+ antiporter MnhB subunit